MQFGRNKSVSFGSGRGSLLTNEREVGGRFPDCIRLSAAIKMKVVFGLQLLAILGPALCLAWSMSDDLNFCEEGLSSKVCQHFTLVTATAINKQINMELTASYDYLAMYNYFSRDDPALYGFAKFFHKASQEESEHAKLLIDYQNLRGGKVTLDPIQPTDKTEWTGLEAMEQALNWEHSVNNNLMALHRSADTYSDAMTMDFLETHLLSEQLTAIKELSSYVSRLSNMAAQRQLAEYHIDQELLKKD